MAQSGSMNALLNGWSCSLSRCRRLSWGRGRRWREACRRIAPAAPRFGGIALSLAHTCPHGPLRLDGAVVQPRRTLSSQRISASAAACTYALSSIVARGLLLAGIRHRRSTASWRQTAEGQCDLAGSGTCGFRCPWHVTRESPALHLSGVMLVLAAFRSSSVSF
jgi:hypothetical protein